MGLHLGIAVVGLIGSAEHRSLQFLGDTGNIAAKLEEQSKPLDCVLVASSAAVARIGLPTAGLKTTWFRLPEGRSRWRSSGSESELQQLLAAG